MLLFYYIIAWQNVVTMQTSNYVKYKIVKLQVCIRKWYNHELKMVSCKIFQIISTKSPSLSLEKHCFTALKNIIIFPLKSANLFFVVHFKKYMSSIYRTHGDINIKVSIYVNFQLDLIDIVNHRDVERRWQNASGRLPNSKIS